MKKIKVGDIYVSISHGTGCVSFFQIVALRGKTQVEVREVAKEIIKERLENDSDGRLVVPMFDNFLRESAKLGKDIYHYSDNKGTVKKLDDENLISIRFSSVYIWNHEPVEDHLYYF